MASVVKRSEKPRGNKTKKKKLSKEKNEENVEFNLDDVKELGGTEDDFEFLKVITEEENDEEITIKEKDQFDEEPIKRSEIETFMSNLGILKHQSKTLETETGEEEKLATKQRKEKNKKLKSETPKKTVSEKPAEIKTALETNQSGRNLENQSGRNLENQSGKNLENRNESNQPNRNESNQPNQRDNRKKTKNKFKQIQHNEISSSTGAEGGSMGGSMGGATGGSVNVSSYTRNHRKRDYLLFKGGNWLNNEFPDDPKRFQIMPSKIVKSLETFAETLMSEEIELYTNRQNRLNSGDAKWMRTVLTSGTLQDRVAALTLRLQDDPIHNLSSLDSLLHMMNKKNRREMLLALDTLREIFLSEILPNDRKLRTFDQHPLCELDHLSSGNRDSRDKRICIWWFENQLKLKYAQFIQAIDTASHDTVPATKMKTLTTISELLTNKPEEENTLLPMLINKLGDPDSKVASKGAYLLEQLVSKHPNMKSVIVLEVERLLYRSNVSDKAQYYAICFLNHLVFDSEDTELAARLIGIYISFFKSFVKKGDVNTKIMSALLVGVNRAYPYAKVEKQLLTDHVDTLYKVVHIVNFNTSVQALMLLYQVMDSNESLSDRYYSALYRKLIDPGLYNSSKHTMFLNLIYKSMLNDLTEKRVKAFIKRLLQVCAHQTVSFVCGALILLAEVVSKRHNLLVLRQTGEDSDSEDEHFIDADEDDEEKEDEEKKEEAVEAEDAIENDENPKQKMKSRASASWIHRQNTGGKKGVNESKQIYDMTHRNPLYCLADRELTCELNKLLNHYHPSVALFTQTTLTGNQVQYTGDPLTDFTLIRFLDRFVYRNPKKKELTYESVQAKKSREPTGIKSIAVDSIKYLKQNENSIPVDEKYLYRYFQRKAAAGLTVTDNDNDEESDADSVCSDEFDQYLDKHESAFDGDHLMDDIDFASEFSKNQTKKGKKSRDEDSDDEEEDDDLSDEEAEIENLDFGDVFDSDGSEDETKEMEIDEENVSFSDDGELEELNSKPSKKPKSGVLLAPKTNKKKLTSKSTNLFASAEEFTHLLEENADNDLDVGGSESLSNTNDKAGVKQLKWEMARDRWIRGADWKTKKRRHQSTSAAATATKRHPSVGASAKKRKISAKRLMKNKKYFSRT
ncbi:CCAAT/enhancer-binding protein zeta-like [Tubulanus polymorphus]|uniref:CCAAT/enhancer-binding protein zeta-like n=1 Tax=Tubulanus polymorphus TaxID=672921 RepID=UPI003DA1EEE5